MRSHVHALSGLKAKLFPPVYQTFMCIYEQASTWTVFMSLNHVTV